MPFKRDVFFAAVRPSLFGGKLSQDQVDGMSFDLDVWEAKHAGEDIRWLAYCMASEYHEVGKRMQPVREGFKKTDAEARKFVSSQGYAYAKPDAVTGEVYYGRGKIQNTWAANYKKATERLDLPAKDDLYQFPDKALDQAISAESMFVGMRDGWYRADKNGRQTLARYFDVDSDDAYGAREIVNGDKTKVPKWANGVSIGNMIKGYHVKFLAALRAAWADPEPLPPPEVIEPPVEVIEPPPVEGPPPEMESSTITITFSVQAPPGVTVLLKQEEA